MRQLALELKTWGGRRKGAGRKPNGLRPLVSHLRRAPLAARHPVHVTLRLLPGVGYLRTQSRARALEAAFRAARDRFGMRLAHYSIQGAHLHLIVEAAGSGALSRGMQGLAIRIARRLNSLAARQGAVFGDRYHAHVLKTRREVANAVRYALRNYVHHARENVADTFLDPFSSARRDAPVAAPRTWLLRQFGRGAVFWRKKSSTRVYIRSRAPSS